jgi:peroxiredoxin
MRTVLLLAALFGVFPAIMAQQVPDFSLTNVVDGSKVSLAGYSSSAGVVVIFTTNACAYDEYYRARINKLAKEHPDNVPVLLVNASVDAPESAENMTKAVQKWGVSAPYLADKDQSLMQSLGATKSPQVFVLKNNGGKFAVLYSGAIDDNAQVEADVRNAYLKDAINSLLSNQKPATTEVRPVGCTIRKK